MPINKGYLAFFESVDLLDPGGNAFFSVFKVKGRVPLRTGLDFYGTVISVLFLKFQDQFDGVSLHLGLGECYLWNFFDFLVGFVFSMRGNLIILFDFFG